MIEGLDVFICSKGFLNIVSVVASEKGLEARFGKKEGEEIIVDFYERNQLAYRIKKKSDYDHEWGVGGHRTDNSVLYGVRVTPLDGVPGQTESSEKLLETERERTWTTYSDDSEDHEGPRHEHTNLYIENEFAREVFERIKARIESRKTRDEQKQ